MSAKAASKIPNHIRDKLSLNISPRKWLEKARILRKSSNHLLIEYEKEQSDYADEFERDPDTNRAKPDDDVVVLLLGFGIENLLKGLFVAAVRCRMHGGPSPGAPKGNQHAYKHGRYSAEAIARRRKISGLIRIARALESGSL
jgi:hypothetical protein